ncbi:tyrosine-type recombinase/integrase [Acidiferrobacter sp.]|uniref:tyrosine-type recombinase/integrase n=1 Tax=Acidiferrobacter sp. TaxID=1872107 RepID=UPI00261C1FDA|nr:tyrosine-type recombinase/integrase [Acidiferrobacter sp.]
MTANRRDCIPSSRTSLLTEYLDYLQYQQSVAPATVVIRRLAVRLFLQSLGLTTSTKLRHLDAKRIHDYVIRRSPKLSRSSRKHLTSSLRSFLRFAHIRGYLGRELVSAVPIIASPRQEGLPRGISWAEVQRLLRAPDRRTATGRRDYAMILLIATYGVRIGQVRALKRSDIHWREQTIAFAPSKGGKPLVFPLAKPVAQALLAYFRRDRGDAPCEEVFLTLGARSGRPLGVHHHLGGALKTYYERAGIDAPVKGSHAIRHAVATRLLSRGASIKTIADILGHRHIDTTYIYTKVDLAQLRTLAQPWPGVRS